MGPNIQKILNMLKFQTLKKSLKTYVTLYTQLVKNIISKVFFLLHKYKANITDVKINQTIQQYDLI